MVETGTYAELLASSSSFNRLLENIHQQEQKQERAGIPEHKRMLGSTANAETDEEDIITASVVNIETKKEGSVNWHVYVAYIQAGAGLILSIFLIIVVFGLREATAVFYDRWLAEWSNDESYRHRKFNDCPNQKNEFVNTIQSMNASQWNTYQQGRFTIYSGSFISLLHTSRTSENFSSCVLQNYRESMMLHKYPYPILFSSRYWPDSCCGHSDSYSRGEIYVLKCRSSTA